MTGFSRALLRRAGLALAFGTALLAAGPVHEAQAQAQSVVGTLNCRVQGGFSFIFGSTRELQCQFESAGGDRIQGYFGRINKYGVDIGFVRSGVILWSVIGSAAPSDGALEGNYIGASAQVAAAFGAGANALLGTNNFMLNPISITGLRGVNVAAGIASLELRAAGEPRYEAPFPQPPR